ncbi:MAG TPA: serine/threonine-protein kinase, partial [Gemmatimonadaceae bacterium]|nr:serine/threonine-protein kinase [Gemmatimonadaceae bacterium]
MAQSLADLRAALASTYTIDRELGRGGMATVYLANDLRHDRPVALKVLHPDLGAVLGAERFTREIRLAARLQHPHILSVYDSGQTPDGQLWFTMPYVEGENLRARLAREHQLPIDQAVRIASDAAQALQYAHEHGVVHRDIKPENLLLTKDGTVLVADFGIARGLGGGEAGATPARLTETGLVVGTPAYMSPEQASGERDIGPASDVYSLAAVLYEMLAGEPPFTGATAQAVVAKMLSGEAPPVRRARPQVPEAVDAAIRTALSPVPADRFASAGDFARALTTAVTTARPSPRRSSSSAPAATHRRVPTGFALLIVGVILGSGALF